MYSKFSTTLTTYGGQWVVFKEKEKKSYALMLNQNTQGFVRIFGVLSYETVYNWLNTLKKIFV